MTIGTSEAETFWTEFLRQRRRASRAQLSYTTRWDTIAGHALLFAVDARSPHDGARRAGLLESFSTVRAGPDDSECARDARGEIVTPIAPTRAEPPHPRRRSGAGLSTSAVSGHGLLAEAKVGVNDPLSVQDRGERPGNPAAPLDAASTADQLLALAHGPAHDMPHELLGQALNGQQFIRSPKETGPGGSGDDGHRDDGPGGLVGEDVKRRAVARDAGICRRAAHRIGCRQQDRSGMAPEERGSAGAAPWPPRPGLQDAGRDDRARASRNCARASCFAGSLEWGQGGRPRRCRPRSLIAPAARPIQS